MGVRGESVGLGRGQPDPLGVTGVVSASLSDGERVVVAVDPGRAKCGVACVAESGSVIERAVLGLDEVVEWVGRACEGREALVVVGDGTGHAAVEQQLAVAHIAWVRVCEP
ncbi:MAG: hypothetical protein FJX72_17790, partial [Armatimonadetes bacterium]|nr:hypothetical protein [Armatimonadota bacterium]